MPSPSVRQSARRARVRALRNAALTALEGQESLPEGERCHLCGKGASTDEPPLIAACCCSELVHPHCLKACLKKKVHGNLDYKTLLEQTFFEVLTCEKCGSCYRLRFANSFLMMAAEFGTFLGSIAFVIVLCLHGFFRQKLSPLMFDLIYLLPDTVLGVIRLWSSNGFGPLLINLNRLSRCWIMRYEASQEGPELTELAQDRLCTVYFVGANVIRCSKLLARFILYVAVATAEPTSYLLCSMREATPALTEVPALTDALAATDAPALSDDPALRHSSSPSDAQSTRAPESPSDAPATPRVGHGLDEAAAQNRNEKVRCECICCLDRTASFVADGCGHLVACGDCRRRLVYKELRDCKVHGLPTMRQLPGELLRETSLNCPACRTSGILVERRSFTGRLFTP
eukprot:gb/GFBE01006786.1/.p1 GENE.gb/GFBE01006786.1/~~gb/GFBE01006786.1/.p1  ORF type:complete len:401 (+),score=45.66 gb/GFBE01006786.1/:1-1203(+)